MGFFDFLKPIFGSQSGALTPVINRVVENSGVKYENSFAQNALNAAKGVPANVALLTEKGEEALNWAEKNVQSDAAKKIAEQIPGGEKALDMTVGAIESAKAVNKELGDGARTVAGLIPK